MRRFWMFGGMLMEVAEDDYVKLNREKGRMQYLYKLEKEFSTLSYDSINEDEDYGAIILKTLELSVYEVVEMRMMAERLYEVLKELADEEKQLIQALTDTEIKTSYDIVDVLRSGEYMFEIGGSIVLP